jgi:hypothetical protein
MDLEEAVELIMKRTGRTRRQAKKALIEKLKSGEIHARGLVVGSNQSGEQIAQIVPIQPSKQP